MLNPKNFKYPKVFKADRFLKNGKFVNDQKVCSFSVGLRNCLGYQIAKDEYFEFSKEIIKKFQFKRISGVLEPIEKCLVLTPKPVKMEFICRRKHYSGK